MSGVALRDVTLPNGEIMEDVPVGTTDAQLADQILSRGIADAATLQSWGMVGGVKPAPSPQPGVALPEAPQTDDERVAQWERDNVGMARGWEGTKADAASVWDAIGNNQDVFAGLGMSLAGAKAGAMAGTAILPGWGTFGGAALGSIGLGAAGTYFGSLSSDMFAGEDVDTDKALDLALLSGTIDVFTLGVAKLWKPFGRVMGFNVDELGPIVQRFLQTKPTDSVANVGSKESLRATQELLQEGATDPVTGARIQSSLTAFQTGEAGAGRKIAEGLGGMGIFSGNKYVDQTARAFVIIQKKLDAIMTDALSGVATRGEIGEAMYGVVLAGKAANNKMRDAAMVGVRDLVGEAVFTPSAIKGVLTEFRKKGARSFDSVYEKETQDLVETWIKQFSQPGKMPTRDLMDFQTKMNRAISKLATGDGANPAASAQLAELAGLMRTRISKVIGRTNPEAATKFTAANKAWGEGIENIMPKLNANIVSKGSKGDYAAIATMLEGTNPDKIAKFMKSVDESFVQAEMAGVDMFAQTGFKSAQDIKNVMHDSFITSIFEGIDPAKVALKFEKRKFAESAIAVLGPAKFVQMKRIANAFRDVASVPDATLGSLAIRYKEVDAVTGGGGINAISKVGNALGIFLIPSMLAKWASRPKSVTYLLSAQKEIDSLYKQAAKSPARRLALLNAAADLTAKASEKLWSDLSEEEQVEMRNHFRGLDNTPVGPNTLHTLDAQQKAQQQAQQGG